MKRSSFLEDLFEIAAKLRWYYALIIALGCYLLFSYLASSPVVYNPKTGAAGIGSFAGKQLLTVVSGLLRYIVPAIFCLGALVAFFKQRKRNSLYENVLGQNASVHIDAGYKLSSMTWEDFEYLTEEYFSRKGFRTAKRGGNSADGGVDIELFLGGDKYLVQCKHWRSQKVSVGVVRELYGVMIAEGAVGSYVVASGGFTNDAHEFAKGREIFLVSIREILSCQQAMPKMPLPNNKSGAAKLSPECPDCGAKMIKRLATRGQNKGNLFWGCSRFPECRGTQHS